MQGLLLIQILNLIVQSCKLCYIYNRQKNPGGSLCFFFQAIQGEWWTVILAMALLWFVLSLWEEIDKKRNKKNWRWLTFLSLRWDSCSLTVDFNSDGCFAAVSALLLACLPSQVFSGPADKPACPMAAGLSHRRGDRLLVMSGRAVSGGLSTLMFPRKA